MIVPRLRASSLLALVLAIVSFGGAPAAAEVGAREEPIVYDTDDRVDVYAEVDDTWRNLAIQSVVTLVENDAIRATGATFDLDARPLSDVGGVCADQRFADQPSASYCSATLIDDDLVLTAGHCVTRPYDPATPAAPMHPCGSQKFVFDYYEEASSTLATVDAADVYACRRIVVRELDATLDFAIVQLDRPVSGRQPALVAPTDGEVPIGTPITVIGSPSGLPIKIAGNAIVTSPGPVGLRYFLGDPDTFGGNSGSGVFDDTQHVLGILVRGGEDYVPRPGGSCFEVKSVSSTEAGEEMTYVHRATDALCGLHYPSARLCGIAPSCGDGFCTSGEPTSCAADCDGAVCGDGVCASGENGSRCSLDCDPASVKKRGCNAASGGGAANGASALAMLLLFAISRSRSRRARR